MTRRTRIQLHQERMKFSAGHFTIFSAHERENLHGHNFSVQALIDTRVLEDGLAFNYREMKAVILTICEKLDEITLLPLDNPHLRVTRTDQLVTAEFAGDVMRFLPRDVKCLPIRNVTVEELSHWFLGDLLANCPAPLRSTLHAIELRISSGPGQSGASFWSENDEIRGHHGS